MSPPFTPTSILSNSQKWKKNVVYVRSHKYVTTYQKNGLTQKNTLPNLCHHPQEGSNTLNKEKQLVLCMCVTHKAYRDT